MLARWHLSVLGEMLASIRRLEKDGIGGTLVLVYPKTDIQISFAAIPYMVYHRLSPLVVYSFPDRI